MNGETAKKDIIVPTEKPVKVAAITTKAPPKTDESDTKTVAEKKPELAAPNQTPQTQDATTAENSADSSSAPGLKTANGSVTKDKNAINTQNNNNSNNGDENGNKRVAKQKWTRVPIEIPAKSSRNKRPERSPRRRRNDDYYEEYYERPIRRGPRRGAPAPSSYRGGSTSSRYSTRGATSSNPPVRRGYITRSNRPSYTESPSAQALNGHHAAPKTVDQTERRITTPNNGRMSADSPAFMPQQMYGTFYFNGAPPFMLDTNVKESIKKQM